MSSNRIINLVSIHYFLNFRVNHQRNPIQKSIGFKSFFVLNETFLRHVNVNVIIYEIFLVLNISIVSMKKFHCWKDKMSLSKYRIPRMSLISWVVNKSFFCFFLIIKLFQIIQLRNCFLFNIFLDPLQEKMLAERTCVSNLNFMNV